MNHPSHLCPTINYAKAEEEQYERQKAQYDSERDQTIQQAEEEIEVFTSARTSPTHSKAEAMKSASRIEHNWPTGEKQIPTLMSLKPKVSRQSQEAVKRFVQQSLGKSQLNPTAPRYEPPTRTGGETPRYSGLMQMPPPPSPDEPMDYTGARPPLIQSRSMVDQPTHPLQQMYQQQQPQMFGQQYYIQTQYGLQPVSAFNLQMPKGFARSSAPPYQFYQYPYSMNFNQPPSYQTYYHQAQASQMQIPFSATMPNPYASTPVRITEIKSTSLPQINIHQAHC